MATNQANVTETIAQIAAEAAGMVVQSMAMPMAENNQMNVGPKKGSLLMRQPMFDWHSSDKYAELRNLRMEVNNMFQNYNIKQTERVSIIKNWLDRQGLQLLENLTQA